MGEGVRPLRAQTRIHAQNCCLWVTRTGPTPWMLIPLNHSASSLTSESNLESNPFNTAFEEHRRPFNISGTSHLIENFFSRKTALPQAQRVTQSR